MHETGLCRGTLVPNFARIRQLMTTVPKEITPISKFTDVAMSLFTKLKITPQHFVDIITNSKHRGRKIYKTKHQP